MTVIHPQDIGIIILAAGSSQRFGDDKRQAQLSKDKTLLQTTLENIPASFTKKLLVLHPGDENLASQFSKGWQICIADDAQQGMGSSLSSAIHLTNGWAGAVISLGDMPYLKSDTVSAVQTSLCQHEIVTPIFNGKRGNPVGFQEKYFEELKALQGEQGAKGLLQKYNAICHQLHTNDEGILKDIDTREALEKAQAEPDFQKQLL